MIRPFSMLTLVLLVLATGLRAEPLRAPVHSVASDAVYLGLGSASGLATGMKGALIEAGDRGTELEILFVSANRSSCRVSPAGADVRVGDLFLFEVAAAAPGDSLVAANQAPKQPAIPPEGVAAIQRAATARGPQARGWWRADLAVSRDGGQSGLLSRQALGLRAGLAQWKGVDLSLQLRHRSEWKPKAVQEGWLDELALAGPAFNGAMKWEVGRLADGRNVLTGPMDGVSVEQTGKRDWMWGLSAGSRAGALHESADRALGAGGRLRYSGKASPLSSDLKARLEKDLDGMATAGLSWSNQLRFLEAGRLEQWFRTELSEASKWKRSETRFSSTRLRWQGAVWQTEARHQVSNWPLQAPEDRLSGMPDTLGSRTSRQLSVSLARAVNGNWVQAQLQARGAQLNGSTERLLQLGMTRNLSQGLLSRVSLNSQILLGPEDSGQDLEVRLSASPERWPDLEWSLRGWRMDLGLEKWTGWNSSLFARGRLGPLLRWEAGGLLQRTQDAWEREVRVGLRGDLRLKPHSPRRGT